MCLAITSIRKPWLAGQPWRCKAQISLQENMLACFLQVPHVKIHHNIMLRPRSPWAALSQRLSLAKVQSRTMPTQCSMGSLCHAAENFSELHCYLRFLPIILPFLFPFTGIRSSLCLKGSLYFCSPLLYLPQMFPSYISNSILVFVSQRTWTDKLKVSQASLCQTFV